MEYVRSFRSYEKYIVGKRCFQSIDEALLGERLVTERGVVDFSRKKRYRERSEKECWEARKG